MFQHDSFAVRDHRDNERPLTDEERAEWKEEGLSEEFCSQCGANTLHVHLVCTNCMEEE